MSKIVKNSTSLTSNNLPEIKEKLTQISEARAAFLPSPSQRMAKSRFWARYDSALLGEPETLSLAAIARITKDNRLDRWWSEPEFKSWFLNRDETAERLDYLFNLGLDKIESIFLDPDSNPNAAVNAFKQISALAGKEPSKNQTFTDEDIQRMPPEKLKAYIERHAPKYLPAPTPASEAAADIVDKTDE